MPPACSDVSAAILTVAVRQSQHMIDKVLSAAMDLFQLSFSHVAQADHAVVAEHIRRQHAFAGTPHGELGRRLFVIGNKVFLA